MATGQQIHDALPLPSGLRTITITKSAVNAVLGESWPTYKKKYRDTSVTLLDGTYEYNLSALSGIGDWGIAQVAVRLTTGEDVLLREWEQVFDTTWRLRLPKAIVSKYSGRPLTILYQGPLPLITSISDETGLPLRYAIYAVAHWYCMYAASTQPAGQQRDWLATADRYYELAELARQDSPHLPLPHRSRKLGDQLGYVSPVNGFTPEQ